MVKKKNLLFCVVIILTVYWGIAYVFDFHIGYKILTKASSLGLKHNHYLPSKIRIDSTDKTIEDISKIIIRSYLDQFRRHYISSDIKIQEYSIEKIEIISHTNSEILFIATYSVMPESGAYAFMPGRDIKNGWIRHIVSNIKVSKNMDVYKIIDVSNEKR